MLFVEDFLPLLVVVYGARFDDAQLDELAVGFERHFMRGERYAVLALSVDGFAQTGARERKLIADWANTPRVMDASRRLGVGSVAVLPSAMARAALTALFWLWTPPTPVCATATLDEGIEYCVRSLFLAGLPFGRSSEEVRMDLVERLRDLGDFGGAIEPSSRYPASGQLGAGSSQPPARSSQPPAGISQFPTSLHPSARSSRFPGMSLPPRISQFPTSSFPASSSVPARRNRPL